MNDILPTSAPADTLAARPAVPRFAATLMVLRDGPEGMEVLMLRRAERGSDIFSGSCVFPGGTVDSRDAQLHGCCRGLDDAGASALLKLPANGLDLFIAAIRETFEESGLLIAYEPDGTLVDLDRLASPELAAMRTALQEGEQGFAGLCGRLGITLAVDRLAYASHWLTPLGMPKRFDTRFFVTVAPASQTALHDDRETLQHLWLRPADALAQAKALKLMPVTQGQLKMLSAFDAAEACFQATLARSDIEMITPRVAQGAEGRQVVLPGMPAYAEIGRIDPLGHGRASTQLLPGVPVRLSPRVIRVTADNGSMMTGPGTNTYLIGGDGDGPGDWAVLDPGPLEDSHVAAILAAAPGPITRIVVTHTHKDHSPAAAALKAATGAPLLGQAARHGEWQDTAFQPDQPLVGGERIEVAPGTTLRVIHTPGHASNHLCYLLEEERLLFTGDHVMQGSTVVINPPDGDMSAYIASLAELADADLEWLAPGHGFLIDQPSQAIRRIVAHRLKREAKVLDAVRRHGPASIDELLPVVYDDVSPHLHPPARRSLMAHLGKLKDDGAVHDADGSWMVIER
jgi:glyoxylase-like metal-dependent hydrolase (beta-lactamase superfamily II)/8-oxo-dGTP pyrophosphatase MutT (NUDIX family)